MINTKYRSNRSEIMDDFTLNGEMLLNTSDQIANINRILGGNKTTINGLKRILNDLPKDKTYTIIDLGCGNGDLLRVIAEFGKKMAFKFNLIGIDANVHILSHAKELSQYYREISYIHQDVLASDYKPLHCDIVLATLFLHHLSEENCLQLLSKQLEKTKLGIVINDLHRHPLAYYLFKFVCLGINNPMVRNDGLISILRGFKKEDLQQMSNKLNVKSSITWRWAFRYQWIIKK